MKVAERLARREPTWRELDALLVRLEAHGISRRPRRRPGEAPPAARALAEPGPGRSMFATVPLGSAEVIRMAELYRSACADLMLAEAYDLPGETVAYLHALVARAHNALYRSKGLRFRTWAAELFQTVPARLRRDFLLPLAAFIFYGPFLLFGLLAATQPDFAETVLGEGHIAQMEEMYAEPVDEGERNDAMMAGFYIRNNAGIGLQCFGAGLLLGLGSIYIMFTNAMVLGTVFGHMLRTPHAANFYEFVTAHGPFELTAIVFSGAAGMRLGWGLIHTRGQTRVDSLRREARNALPTAGAAVFLFILAAFLEGFVSASTLPYAAKAGLAVASAVALLAYLFLGGRSSAARAAS
jgi:uncharacterized membrane protein SpoIIM required for sporulation